MKNRFQLNIPIGRIIDMINLTIDGRNIEVPEGTRLIWIDGQGYILPDFEVKTTKEIIEDMDCIKEF